MVKTIELKDEDFLFLTDSLKSFAENEEDSTKSSDVEELIKKIELATSTRKFELVAKFSEDLDLLPKRATANSAGYDLKAAETVIIKPGEIKLVPTGLKAFMQKDEVLYLYDRSSNPKKQGFVLANSVGVIDSDYYNNPDNEGLIYGQFMNITDKEIRIKKGDRIMQGVFSKFLTVDNDKTGGERLGGFGSTGK
jgi:dUTP diphosphatase